MEKHHRKLKDKVAVVTGAASGIGASTAVRLAREGAHVALVDINLDGLAETREAIESEQGSALVLLGDVTRGDTASGGVAKIVEKWGRLDILVTASGISTGGTVVSIDDATWDRVFAVNVKGTYFWLHHALPEMISRGKGAVVLVGSQLVVSSGGNNAAYIASKGAIASLAKTMAVDHAAQGIRVNAVMPGVIDTPMSRRGIQRYGTPDATKQKWTERHPMKRFGTPEEVAEAILFLASDDASFCTGSLLFVDGGWCAM